MLRLKRSTNKRSLTAPAAFRIRNYTISSADVICSDSKSHCNRSSISFRNTCGCCVVSLNYGHQLAVVPPPPFVIVAFQLEKIARRYVSDVHHHRHRRLNLFCFRKSEHLRSAVAECYLDNAFRVTNCARHHFKTPLILNPHLVRVVSRSVVGCAAFCKRSRKNSSWLLVQERRRRRSALSPHICVCSWESDNKHIRALRVLSSTGPLVFWPYSLQNVEFPKQQVLTGEPNCQATSLTETLRGQC